MGLYRTPPTTLQYRVEYRIEFELRISQTCGYFGNLSQNIPF